MALIHERPQYVKDFKKGKNTEIKFIRGNWYLYSRSGEYDPTTKKMRKKSGSIIGKITENGLVYARPKVDSSSLDRVTTVEIGFTGYLHQTFKEIAEKLKKHFPDCWKELFAVACLRLSEGPRFKRISTAYEDSCLSVLYNGLDLDKSDLTDLLKAVGRRRENIVAFMRDSMAASSSFLVFDGHRLISESKTLEEAAMGYDSRNRYKKQINLLYAFTISGQKYMPYFYKMFSGDIPDVSAFPDFIRECGIKDMDVTILADKGYASDRNFQMLKDLGLSFVIPRRRNEECTILCVPETHGEYDDMFRYAGRTILHKVSVLNGEYVHVFLDSFLYANELNDMARRLERDNATVAKKRIAEERARSGGKRRMSDEDFEMLQEIGIGEAMSGRKEMGTLTLVTNNEKLTGPQIYYMYKRREVIEDFFKAYDDSLDLSASYMRDTYSEEAWLFLNHIGAMMSFEIFDRIYALDKVKDISIHDFISMFSKIHVNRISGVWHTTVLTKKKAAMAKLFGLDIDSLVSEMNAHEHK